MINAERINQWLHSPHELQEVLPEAIIYLTEKYPYFSVAQVLFYLLPSSEKNEEEAYRLRNNLNIHPILLQILKNQSELKKDQINSTFLQDKKNITDKAAKQITGDYFAQQGELIEDKIPLDFLKKREKKAVVQEDEETTEKSLMVVMSFTEWISYITQNTKIIKEEIEEQKALKTKWQKEKLAAALEEDTDEIPQEVFEMAVNSIAMEEDLASESLAEVYVRQGKIEHAVDMYKKLSLQNPQKSFYFARKIENLQKDTEI